MGQPGFDIDTWVADAKAKAERYQEMRAQAEALSVTESSPDEVVTVTVDSGGNVTDLRIADDVSRLRGGEIAAAVLATLRRAQSRLPDRIGDVMRGTVGQDRATIDTVVGRFRERFPEPEPDEGAAEVVEDTRLGELEDDAEPAAPARARRPERPPAGNDEDEDFEQDSILGQDE